MINTRKAFRGIFQLFLAAGITTLAAVVLTLMRSILSTSVIALLFLIPLVINVSLFGRLAGITTSILSFLIFNYFFISPYYTLRVNHAQDLLVLTVFLGVALVIGSLISQSQQNLKRAQARERQAMQMFELSEALAGKGDVQEIAHILTQKLATLFPDRVIQVRIWDGEKQISLCTPEGSDVTEGAEGEMIFSLGSVNKDHGDIRIWVQEEKLTPEEERLIQTVARQGSLALDRSILSTRQTRTKIIEESDRLKTAILSSVSHELRTPLASIQAAATGMFDPNVNLEPEARAELQSLLLEETETMAQLVGNLLNMSRLEAGALKLQRQWNSMAEIVDTGLRRLHRMSGDHPIRVDVPDSLPLISVDSILLEQVIINLIRNSIRHTPSQTEISIEARVIGEVIRVTVSNQGPNIMDEMLEHVFEKFYPIKGRESSQGTGLGLSICKGIIEAHGGKIWAENLPVGVAFHFELPLIWNGEEPILPHGEDEAK